ncbi:MAG: hypothetical protein K9I95_12260 [Flavobacteriaceae bacterium]|nr:hypothetical protein [Flavobacteriaceae bacterium]
MIKSALIFGLLLSLNITTVSSKNIENYKTTNHYLINEQTNDLDWSKINLVKIEEEAEIGFDTKAFLPENFNPLKGKNDLNWNKIELIKVEEDVNLDFDTKAYLPINFNALKGKNDLDWNSIKLEKIEEEVELDFDTRDYLPIGFNAYSGITNCKTVS